MSTFCICFLFVTIYPQFTFYHQDEVWKVFKDLYIMPMHGGVCVFAWNTKFEVRKGNTESLESEIPQIYSWSHNPAGFGLVMMMMMILLAYLCGYSFLTVYLCKWDFLTGASTQRFPHPGVRWKIQRGALFSWSQYLFKQKPSLIILFGFLSFGKWLIL